MNLNLAHFMPPASWQNQELFIAWADTHISIPVVVDTDTKMMQKIDEKVRNAKGEVTASLAAMDSPQREVIVMHLWGGLTFEAIGQILDMSRASAHRSFQLGLASLKRQFCCEPNFNSMRICHE